MQLKNLIIGVAVLGGLAAAAVFLSRSPQPEPLNPREGQPLVSDAQLRDLDRIVFRADNQPAAELRRTGSGNWQLQGDLPEPVEFSRLSRLAQSLRDATVDRFVSSNPDRLQRLDLGSTGLELYAAGADSPFLAFDLGKAADSGGSYLRFADQEEAAYLISERLWLQTDPDNWRDRTPIDWELGDLAAVTVSFSPQNGNSLAFSRQDPDADFQLQTELDDKEVDKQRLQRFLRSLLSLRSTRTVARDSSEASQADEFRQTVSLRSFDDATIQLAVGRKPEVPALSESAPMESSGDSNTDQSPEPEPLEPAGPVIVWLEQLPPNHPFAPLAESHAFVVADSLMDNFPARSELLTDQSPPAPEDPSPTE